MDFYNFAYLPQNFADKLENLAKIARPERWKYLQDVNESHFEYPILFNYIVLTFQRLYLMNTKKPDFGYLYMNNNVCCFNTGLFTKNFESIYVLLYPNAAKYNQAWVLDGFYKASSRELQKIGRLPARATYFDNITDLIYDTNLELRVNIDHILNDERNKERIPIVYRSLPNLPMLFKGAALEYAKVRIMENYKSAVPQCFNGKIQFLIPISLGDPEKVDLSLAVEKVEDVYTGRTCLTLDMAYNNARLIAKPESDWLVGN